jgi:hypothetical protein
LKNSEKIKNPQKQKAGLDILSSPAFKSLTFNKTVISNKNNRFILNHFYLKVINTVRSTPSARSTRN